MIRVSRTAGLAPPQPWRYLPTIIPRQPGSIREFTFARLMKSARTRGRQVARFVSTHALGRCPKHGCS
jgi:hypothetical protein